MTSFFRNDKPVNRDSCIDPSTPPSLAVLARSSVQDDRAASHPAHHDGRGVVRDCAAVRKILYFCEQRTCASVVPAQEFNKTVTAVLFAGDVGGFNYAVGIRQQAIACLQP